MFKTSVGRGKMIFLQKRGTLGHALLIEMLYGTSGCLWSGPATAGISSQGKHGSRTHVRETEQEVLKPSQICET